MENKLWYAVMSDRNDDDWGTGSFDLEEAREMLKQYPDGYIAVIENGVCIDEIEPERHYEKIHMDKKSFIESCEVSNDENNIFVIIGNAQITGPSPVEFLGREESEPFEASYTLESDHENQMWDFFYDEYRKLFNN